MFWTTTIKTINFSRCVMHFRSFPTYTRPAFQRYIVRTYNWYKSVASNNPYVLNSLLLHALGTFHLLSELQSEVCYFSLKYKQPVFISRTSGFTVEWNPHNNPFKESPTACKHRKLQQVHWDTWLKTSVFQTRIRRGPVRIWAIITVLLSFLIFPYLSRQLPTQFLEMGHDRLQHVSKFIIHWPPQHSTLYGAR